MAKITVVVRKLTADEIIFLNEEIAKSPHPLFFGKKEWCEADKIYTISVENNLAGVCVVYNLGDWLKLGPLIIAQKFQHQGLGRIVLKKIVSENKNVNIYIGSHNPYVGKIVEKMGFVKRSASSFFSLPKEIIFYYLQFFAGRINLKCLSEWYRKMRKFRNHNKYFLYFKFALK
ncbi:GNAT family N-acetyltransferase [Candidatus Gottesmanbacteria bacterium]|nr:GNAT family N-acetyltransferase [Candidatus Gottesmanbacteria bacterium]